MFQSLPNPEPDFDAGEHRNPWAFVDLIVFGIFSFAAFIALGISFSRLPPIYAIPLQGLFNCALVGFIAVWIRFVRHASFIEYVHLFRSRVFSTRSLIALAATLAISVSVVSIFLPSTGPSPLEKFLTSGSAILLFALFGVAVAPLTEELIFRGFLFKVFEEIGGSRLAIIATAVIFAAPHVLQLGNNWGAGILILIVGFVLSVIRHRSNSIVPSFIVHTFYNMTLVVVSPIIAILQKLVK